MVNCEGKHPHRQEPWLFPDVFKWQNQPSCLLTVASLFLLLNYFSWVFVTSIWIWWSNLGRLSARQTSYPLCYRSCLTLAHLIQLLTPPYVFQWSHNFFNNAESHNPTHLPSSQVTYVNMSLDVLDIYIQCDSKFIISETIVLFWVWINVTLVYKSHWNLSFR